MFSRPCNALPRQVGAERCGEELSFQSFLQHATLFLPRFNTEFVSTGKWRRRFGLFRTAEDHRGTGPTALLEFKIHTKTHLGAPPAEERGGGASATARTGNPSAMRLGRAVFAALALIATAAGLVWHPTGWGQTGQGAGNPATAGGPKRPGSAAAAPETSQASSTATLQVFSRLTVVDVTVTDAKDQPVRGLKESDFTGGRSRQRVRQSGHAGAPIDRAEETGQAGQPAWGERWTLIARSQAVSGCEDFSCKSFAPRRIMPLIFGNHFRWEISQEINRRILSAAAQSAGPQMH